MDNEIPVYNEDLWYQPTATVAVHAERMGARSVTHDALEAALRGGLSRGMFKDAPTEALIAANRVELYKQLKAGQARHRGPSAP